jgi:hypothetical protein
VPTVKKSQASVAVACARRNSGQVGPELLGAGPVPCRRKMAHTLEGASRTPMVASSPWIRRYPHVGFSLVRRRTTETVPVGSAGRPGRRPEWAHFRRTRSRCQRSTVSGRTKKRPRRPTESSPLSAARTARSEGRRAGRATWRRKTETSWRSTTTSTTRSCCPRRDRRSSWRRRRKAR